MMSKLGLGGRGRCADTLGMVDEAEEGDGFGSPLAG
jgi:hypothetical protein